MRDIMPIRSWVRGAPDFRAGGDQARRVGIEVHRGIAGTGVVGTLRGQGGGTRAIGLRADMDALAIGGQRLRPCLAPSRQDARLRP
ncbi:hypothetical protein [Azospirillum thermophilum]|uniref:hypothetical protein n=1 Tax=Azospirillum thermophilum TaxID=2202148 RepID=UPI0031844AFB